MLNQFKHPAEHVKVVEDGHQLVFKFANNYGASVVSHRYSYGGDQGLWELAVIKWEEQRWSLVYDTPITDDVIGCLSVEEVNEYLDQIKGLT